MLLSERIEADRITCQATPIAPAGRGRSEFAVTLHNGKRDTIMSLHDYSGPTDSANVLDVMGTVLAMVSFVTSAEGFRDWCTQRGEEPSTEARETYRLQLREVSRFRTFLGGKDFNLYLYETERDD